MKFRFSIVTVLLTLLFAVNSCLALSAGGRRTIEMLVMGGPESQRDAAQTVYNGFDHSPEVLDVMAEVLLQTYQRPGFVQVDATSWMCKALGASGNVRYRGVLQQVADKAAERKVRKYAEQSLGMLPQGNATPYIAGTVNLTKLRDGATHAKETPTTNAKAEPPTSGGTGNAAFDRITHGMSMEEVFSLIGQPTTTSSRITGKAWAPFYHGGDTARLFALYKGKGRIVFSNASQFSPVWRVMDIVRDPSESGYP
ncbi:MAG: hypothetical protein KJ630_15115 [Proteobacteria bacterium]|nr:hypothetical protein [Pseudomonadota bacterium]